MVPDVDQAQLRNFESSRSHSGHQFCFAGQFNTRVVFMETMQEVKKEGDDIANGDGSTLEPEAALREEAEK